MLLTALISTAKDEAVKLIIKHHDGITTSFKLDEKPVCTFSSEDLVISTQTSNYSTPLSNIKNFFYENVFSDIEITPFNGVSISQKGTTLFIKGLAENEVVTIYNMEGKQMYNDRVTGVDAFTISIECFPRGIYVVKTIDITFKFLKQ